MSSIVPRTSRVWLAIATSCLLSASLSASANGPARAARLSIHAAASDGPRIEWARVDPYNPRLLFAAGVGYCHSVTVVSPSQECPTWLQRSQDGGATWQDLGSLLGPEPPVGQGHLYPPLFAPGGRVYLPDFLYGLSADSGGTGYFASVNNGSAWSGYWNPGGYGGGIDDIAVSPANPQRLYAVLRAGSSGSTIALRSDHADNPRAWRNGADLINIAGRYSREALPLGTIVADPTRVDTVYANMTTDRLEPMFAVRSDDAGLHWTMVMTPAATPPLRSFNVATDPHEGTALVGRTADPNVPPDRRYLSTDQGRTWRATTCPGDLRGQCPLFTVDNVFGAGAAYAFTTRGIYRFHGGGPAEARLAISDGLPASMGNILDVTAGSRFGDPVYILARGTNRGVGGVLYRSLDAGRTWHVRTAGILPTMVAPRYAPGDLYVRQTRHYVAAPFVAT